MSFKAQKYIEKQYFEKFNPPIFLDALYSEISNFQGMLKCREFVSRGLSLFMKGKLSSSNSFDLLKLGSGARSRGDFEGRPSQGL